MKYLKKYLKKFSEGLAQKELKEVRYDLEDILIEIDDMNIGRKDDFLYKIGTFSNSSSMRDASISEAFRIDVRFWKNGNFFSWDDYQQLKPIFDRLARSMSGLSSDIKLAILQWDEDGNEFPTEMGYDRMIDHLSFKVGIFDVSDGNGEFLPSKISGFKIKFELK